MGVNAFSEIIYLQEVLHWNRTTADVNKCSVYIGFSHRLDDLSYTSFVADSTVSQYSDRRIMFDFSPEPSDGFPTDKLKVDQAYLNITSNLNRPLWLYTLSSECVAVSSWEFFLSLLTDFSTGFSDFTVFSVRSSCCERSQFHHMVMQSKKSVRHINRVGLFSMLTWDHMRIRTRKYWCG